MGVVITCWTTNSEAVSFTDDTMFAAEPRCSLTNSTKLASTINSSYKALRDASLNCFSIALYKPVVLKPDIKFSFTVYLIPFHKEELLFWKTSWLFTLLVPLLQYLSPFLFHLPHQEAEWSELHLVGMEFLDDFWRKVDSNVISNYNNFSTSASTGCIVWQ